MKNIKIILTILLFISLKSYSKGVEANLVYQELLAKEVLFPEVTMRIIYAQTKFGEYSVNNNLFWFRNKEGYLKFEKWEDCIEYYKDWQNRKYLVHLDEDHSVDDECDYYHFLYSIRFCSGNDYELKREKRFINKLKKLEMPNYFYGLSKEKTVNTLYTELIRQNIYHPEITLKVMGMETAFGKKARHNNLFGFRKGKHYMRFTDWQECIKYYKEWQDKYYLSHLEKYHKGSKCDYYHFLYSIRYLTGDKHQTKSELNYLNKVKTIRLPNLQLLPEFIEEEQISPIVSKPI